MIKEIVGLAVDLAGNAPDCGRDGMYLPVQALLQQRKLRLVNIGHVLHVLFHHLRDVQAGRCGMRENRRRRSWSWRR
jgi:hypothetical protein